MKKYCVTFPVNIYVEAEDEDEAREIANEYFDTRSLDEVDHDVEYPEVQEA